MRNVPHAGAEMLNLVAWPKLAFSKAIKKNVRMTCPLELWDGIREQPARISAS